MKKTISLLMAAVVCITSCKTLTSTTYIKPYQSFVLGNNEHAEAKVKLTNISVNSIEVYHAPIAGGKHSSQMVKPNEKVTVYVEKNTALVIVNAKADTASVKLFVTGDLGLSMGYKQ